MELPSLEFAQVHEIPFHGGISRDQFISCYFEPDQPVVVGGAIDDWTFESVRDIYGERTISIDGVAQDSASEKNFAALVADILGQGPHRKFYAQHCLEDDWADDLIRRLMGDAWFPMPQARYLWLGSGDAGGIGLHQDDGYRNLLIQAVGRKHCVLIPPSDTHLLAMTSLYSDAYPEFPFGYDSFRSQITKVPERPSAADIDWQQFPLLRQAKAFVCVLQPGQSLFIPTSWFHLISSLEANVSVSARWQNPDWLRNRRTFHALLDLTLSFIRALPKQQRDSCRSRLSAELAAKQFEDRQLLDGPVPPQHLFGWTPVRDELLVALRELIETFHKDGLADRLPLKFFELLASGATSPGTQPGAEESPISFFLRPEVAQFVCASHERDPAARMPGTDPVVECANAILQRLAITATTELQKYRSGRSVLLDELRNAAKKLDPSTHPEAAKSLQGLLLEVAAFN